MNTLWAGEWHTHNKLDGKVKYLLYDNCLPVLFRTRKSCRDYIKQKYGYIADRPDLRAEPHGWRIPQAVKVKIIVIPPEETKEIICEQCGKKESKCACLEK